jgi:hypothetical protein
LVSLHGDRILESLKHRGHQKGGWGEHKVQRAKSKQSLPSLSAKITRAESPDW